MFLKKEKTEEPDKVNKGQEIIRKASVYVVRYFDAIVAVIVLVVFIMGFFFIINPKYKSITETEQYSLEDLDAGKTKLSSYLGKLLEYEKVYQSVSEVSKERIDKVAPQDDRLENFFASIENITKKQGLMVTSLSVVEIADEKVAKTEKASPVVPVAGSSGKAEISLAVSGIDYDGIKRLLTVFENNLRLMDVQSIIFDTSAKTAQFVIDAYFLK